DITRIESKTLNLKREHFRIKQIIVDITNNYKNNIDNKNIKFEYISNKDDLIVYADKDSIGRVISNLISNSIKFIPQEKEGEEEGVISIFVEQKKITGVNELEKKIVVVGIKDTGIGIDKQIFPKLFTKFTTKSFQGMGLGLYISKNIIEAHGGKIWAENNNNNKGALFSFSLPLKD
ncbi:MAG: HAMP domain-containing histidine kinase, partial [Nitrosopumilus sp.]|nr:HAMP domain-containing histidine kinase [Nitrosopumilus sp.]